MTSREWSYIRTSKLTRSRTNPEASRVATQVTGTTHIPWRKSLIGTIRRLSSIIYPVAAYICKLIWKMAIRADHSVFHSNYWYVCLWAAYIKHSSLGRRDRRLSTGGVGTPSDEIVVGRFSEFERGNYFQGQTVLALSWTKSENLKIHLPLRKESSVEISINRRALPRWLKNNQATEKRP